MAVYAEALRHVQLAGPTLFSEVLEMAISKASEPVSQSNQRYDVLVIVTDGIIDDMRQVGPVTCLPSPGEGRRGRSGSAARVVPIGWRRGPWPLQT